jgi:hypothetical protein
VTAVSGAYSPNSWVIGRSVCHNVPSLVDISKVRFWRNLSTDKIGTSFYCLCCRAWPVFRLDFFSTESFLLDFLLSFSFTVLLTPARYCLVSSSIFAFVKSSDSNPFAFNIFLIPLSLASLRSASLSSVPSRSASLRSALARQTLLKLAHQRLVSLRLAPRRLAPLKSTQLR